MIGILGGTFDPVHFGHLRIALELQEALGLQEVRMMPSRQPPHRPPPVATAKQRLAMLQAALAGQSALRADDRELHREGPSYTVDTMASLRAELGDTPLCLILGADAFLGLESWHRWREVADGAHLIVAHRPGWTLDVSVGVGFTLRDRTIRDPAQLRTQAAGYVLPWPVTQLDISATRIRAIVAAGKSPRYLLPEEVWKLIQSEGLYQTIPGDECKQQTP